MATQPEYLEYRDWASAVLVDYQFIEEGLRWYLANAYMLIRKTLNGALPFTYAVEDNDKDALGTLISKFEKLNGNTELIKELRALVPHRNTVAHRAFLLTSEQHDDAELLKNLKSQLEAIRVRTHRCVKMIFEETNIVGAKLVPPA